ncbi:hypothetical protein [Paenibacillus sp. 37]|uniref:hypothetical protein n=1 Tax=Paenibacillus sp. 37 TaxID=2607911 RepID=UPI00122E06E0|nr:hypothetical protein [Paenibacillus sp. 37]
MEKFTPQMQSFLENFFGDGNRTTLTSLNDSNSNHAKKIKPFVDRLSNNPSPSVIPFIDSDNNVTWFGLAFDEQQFVMLGDSLHAFLGPSFSSFQRGKQKNDEHIIVPEVNRITNGRFFVFEADNQEVHSQLTKMIGVWESRPKDRKIRSLNIDQLLREFYTALEVNSGADAKASLQSIRDLGQFSAQNLIFLQIQFLSSFQLWDDLFALPGIVEVITARRPLAVTEALLSGIYAQHIAPYEDINDVRTVMEHFKKELWPSYSALFQYRRASQNPDVLKCYAVHAVALSSSQYDISELEGSLRDEPFFQELLAQFTPYQQATTHFTDAYKQAQREMENGRTEKAFRLLRSVPTGVQQTIGLLDCALVLLDLSSIKIALDAYAELKAEEKKQVCATQRMQSTLQILQTFGQATQQPIRRVPDNWIEWILQLEGLEIGVASEIARQGAKQWRVNKLNEQDPGLSVLYASLCNLDSSLKTKMGYALPHMISFFSKDEFWPRLEWKRVYLWLLTCLLESSSGSRADLALFNSIFKQLNVAGLEAEEYRELMEQLLLWIKRNASVNQIETIMETCEILVAAPYREFQIHLPLLQEIHLHINASSSDKWKSVREALSPGNWYEWFNVMMEKQIPANILLSCMPDLDSMEWSPSQIETIFDYFTELYVEEQTQISETLVPRLVDDTLKAPSFPRREMEKIYEILLILMDLSLSRSEENTLQFNRLVDGLLYLRPGSADQHWNAIEGWFDVTPFAALADLLLDAMDLFVDSPLVNEKMSELWNTWCQTLLQHILHGKMTRIREWYRIGKWVNGYYDTLLELKTALNIGFEQEDPLSKLNKQVITIFTLLEKPAKRASEYLTSRNPSLKIRLCLDDRLTDRAKEFARNSDISVVVTTHMSHALTYGIGEHLTSSPVYARSSGESAIIDAIEQYAEKFMEDSLISN